MSFRQSRFGYVADEVLWADKTGVLSREIKRWGLLWRALRGFDIIHFNFGQSIAPQRLPAASARRGRTVPRLLYGCYARLLELRDLPILKRAGKGIVVTFQGDDARQGDYCLDHFEISPAHEVESEYYGRLRDEHKRRRIELIARYADRIYALNPDLLHVLPPAAKFLPYSHIDLAEWKPAGTRDVKTGPPVVVHAPSHRGAKGTRHVVGAVSQLRKEGIPIEFLLVEGLPHAEARQLYERADLVVDQLLCGWYGGLAVEAMALGKPVVAYVREGDLQFIPPGMREELPIINATPATICSVLREWLTVSRHELPELGARCRAYVEKWHDPLEIAAELKRAYEAIPLLAGQGRRV